MSVLESSFTTSVCLAALYLRRGDSRPVSSRRWRLVESALRRRDASLTEVCQALREEGLYDEALILDGTGVLSTAKGLVENGKVLTAADERYPRRWLRFPFAPPALWRVGVPSTQPFLAIVGSRSVPAPLLQFAEEAARQGTRLGFAIVSGGARGCDSAAVRGASAALEILPYGIDHHRSDHPALSLCPPCEPFSPAAAMERNALIYAACEQAVVVHARFREGGTWTGATDALRRRICSLLVREEQSLAHRALIALGAKVLLKPEALAEALSKEEAQASLIF